MQVCVRVRHPHFLNVGCWLVHRAFLLRSSTKCTVSIIPVFCFGSVSRFCSVESFLFLSLHIALHHERSRRLIPGLWETKSIVKWDCERKRKCPPEDSSTIVFLWVSSCCAHCTFCHALMLLLFASITHSSFCLSRTFHLASDAIISIYTVVSSPWSHCFHVFQLMLPMQQAYWRSRFAPFTPFSHLTPVFQRAISPNTGTSRMCVSVLPVSEELTAHWSALQPIICKIAKPLALIPVPTNQSLCGTPTCWTSMRSRSI